MTYSVGNIALASDYMLFRGINDVNIAYPGTSQATNAIAALIGVGYSSRGYGYTELTLPVKNIGDLIQASEWNALRSGVNLINMHISSTETIQPNVTVATDVVAFDGSRSRVNLTDVISGLDTNRLYPNPEVMTLSNVLNSQRTTSWNYATNLYHEFTVDFGSEDAARFFFNTGGAIYISANCTGGASTQMNIAVAQMLSEMGTIIFSATGVTYTGYNGNLFPIGFYNLTTSFEQIFSHYGDQSSMYSNISYIITVRTENYVGINGGNGSLLRFQAIFRLDDYTQDQAPYQAYPPTVSGTLTSSVDSYLSSNVIPITQPTFTTTVDIQTGD